MKTEIIEFSLEIAFGIFLLVKIVHLYFECKTIKALIESAKTSNQRLDSVEKELREKNS